MKMKVDKNICIGCGACAAICPEIFDIDDDGLAVAKDIIINEELIDDAQDAFEGCPVSAIEKENSD